jgi:hypothetical protein
MGSFSYSEEKERACSIHSEDVVMKEGQQVKTDLVVRTT